MLVQPSILAPIKQLQPTVQTPPSKPETYKALTRPDRPNLQTLSRPVYPGLHTCLSSGAPIQDHIHHGALARGMYTRGPKLDDHDKVLTPFLCLCA